MQAANQSQRCKALRVFRRANLVRLYRHPVLLARRHRRRRERLNDLLSTVSPEDEATLTLAMHVALPIIRRLVRNATSPASSKPAESTGADTAVVHAVADAGQ
jgi:hypothetical protein